MTKQDSYEGVVWRSGRRVLLCPPEEDCLEPSHQWINDAQNTRFILQRAPMSMGAQREWLDKRMSKNDKNNFTVFLRAQDGTLIGNMSILIDQEKQSAITGTLIGNRNYQRGGYATEAKLLLLRYAFLERGLRKVTSHIMGPNRDSVRYARRCGYRFSARISAEHFLWGKWRSELIYTAWPETWQEAWESWQQKFS